MRVLPMLELLMSEWEELLENEEYGPVHVALQAGISLLEKYYRRTDDTDVYFIAHGKHYHSYWLSIDVLLVLDPVFKLGYLSAAWEPQYLEVGMTEFKAWVS